MMKAAVFSDTHSNTALMVEAVSRCRPDLIIHLGDHSRDTAILREKFLVYAAQEAGAKIAMFGHTHEAYYGEAGGVQLLNPGTAGKGRTLTWAVVTVFDNGAIVCEIKDL